MRVLKRRRPLLVNLALVVVAVLLTAAGVELGARLLGFDWQVDHNWRYHPQLGWTQVPGARYEMTMNGLDVTVAFNSAGFRDDEHALRAEPGTRRIVVLGDSFSEAIQVPLEATWHQQLEARLSASGQHWEVINLGVGDYGTAQQLLMLGRALAYAPDLVIHQVFPLNDVCNNNVALVGLCKSLNDPYRPYFELRSGALEPADPAPLRRWLRDRILTFFLAERLVRSTLARVVDDAYWAKRFADAGFEALDPLLLTFAPRAGERYPEIEAGWRVTEALIAAIAERTRRAGVAYLGLVIPFEARVGANWTSFISRPRWRDEADRLDVDYPERRLGALFQHLGVPHVALRERFGRDFETVMPYWGGHLSPPGHAVAADELLEPVLALVSPEGLRTDRRRSGDE